MSEREDSIMDTRNVYLLSVSISFVLVYLIFGLYVPDDVYLKVSAVCLVVLGGAFVCGEYNDET